MPLSAPPVVVEAFAVNGLRNTIPVATQIPITPGAASYNDGFPPLTMTPLASSGVPPFGRDMNGILYAISAHTAWQQGGGQYSYSSTFSTANGGYSLGVVLQSSADASIFWLNTVGGNTNNPDVTPTNWVRMDRGGNGYRVASSVAGTNTITATVSPAQISYVYPLYVMLTPAAANTGAVTVNLGPSALPLLNADGSALLGAELSTSVPAMLALRADAAAFILTTSQRLPSTMMEWAKTTPEAAVTVVDYGYPPGDIRRYGATTGSADNTTFVQRAVAQNAAAGAPVFIPAGTWLCNQVSLATGVTIRGEGFWSVLKSKDSANNYLLANTNGATYVDNVAIQSLSIDGNKANNTSGGGILLNGRNCIVTRCYVHDCTNAGISAGAPSNGGIDTPLAGGHQFVNNLLLNNGKSNNWGQVALTHGSSVLIADNLVLCNDGQTDYGIDIEPNSGNLIDGVVISNNVVTAGNIQVDGANLGASGACFNVVISDNRIDRRGSYQSVDDANMAPVWARQARFLTVADNVCYGRANSTFGGIYFDSSGISSTYAVSGGSVTGNIFVSDFATVRSGVFQKCASITIGSNTWIVTTSSNAVEFSGAGTQIRGSENIVLNSGAGNSVNIGAGTDIFWDDSNVYVGTVPTPGGTGNVIELADITASKTWSPGTIASQQGASTQVTVTGVTRTNGSYVRAMIFTTLGTGQVLAGGITNTDEVTIALVNYSGSPVTPSSGTLTVAAGRRLSS